MQIRRWMNWPKPLVDLHSMFCTNPLCNSNAINEAFQAIAELNISESNVLHYELN